MALRAPMKVQCSSVKSQKVQTVKPQKVSGSAGPQQGTLLARSHKSSRARKACNCAMLSLIDVGMDEGFHFGLRESQQALAWGRAPAAETGWHIQVVVSLKASDISLTLCWLLRPLDVSGNCFPYAAVAAGEPGAGCCCHLHRCGSAGCPCLC